jgi:putative Mg2+ transporter-C (MgtC) family protein
MEPARRAPKMVFNGGMDTDSLAILQHLALALVAGGLIGLERTYHGRPAGFRTHTLVCIASSLLIQLTIFRWEWFAAAPLETMRIDPTRMAAGIMTGIGFLGAGVILKEGLTVRGLTTAASIWVTAAIGILLGAGFYFPAFVGTLLALGTLSVFRWIELVMPVLYYSRLEIQFRRHETPREPEIRALIRDHGFSVANLSYMLKGDGKLFEYGMTIRTGRRDDSRRLAETLSADDRVLEFRITPAGD